MLPELKIPILHLIPNAYIPPHKLGELLGMDNIKYFIQVVEKNIQQKGPGTDSNELLKWKVLITNINTAWLDFEKSLIAVNKKILALKVIQPIIQHPFCTLLVLAGLSFSLYLAINDWNSKHDANQSILVIGSIVGTFVGVIGQIGQNNLGNIVAPVRASTKKKVKEIKNQQGALSALLFVSSVLEQYSYQADIPALKEGLKEFKTFLQTDFPGKNLFCSVLMTKIGKLQTLIKNSSKNIVQTESHEEIENENELTQLIDSFISKSIFPRLEALKEMWAPSKVTIIQIDHSAEELI